MLCSPPQIKHNEPPAMKEATPGEKLCGKTFAQEVSPFFTRGGEEWNSQSSENGPSVFQGERATSPFFED
jgi:hypothetical protein